MGKALYILIHPFIGSRGQRIGIHTDKWVRLSHTFVSYVNLTVVLTTMLGEALRGLHMGMHSDRLSHIFIKIRLGQDMIG